MRRPRLQRGVIVATSVVGSVSLITVTWMALKPAAFRQVAQEEALSRPATAALSGLPGSYGDVSEPGPPLPRDLRW